MLEPSYFRGKEEKILELYRRLEDYILKDIARRLLKAGEMTGSADRLIWKLEQAGENRAYIQRELLNITKLAEDELRAILQEAVMTSWADDAETLSQLNVTASNPLENENVISVMNAEYQKTLGELENLTRTTMDQSQRDLINLLDEADMKVASGTYSYNSAIRGVLDAYAGHGTIVTYPSGARRTLEAAVRCCVVTSMNQTSAQVTNQYIVEANCEYVLVSAHLGARTGDDPIASHEYWQGKVYKIEGSEPGYPNLLDSTGYDVNPRTGEGRVVNPLGLHGYNCRHSHKPWDKELRNPYVDKNGNVKIDSEENKKQYELTQKQRAMERAIRATKRKMLVKNEEIEAADGDEKRALQDEYKRMEQKWMGQNKAYNEFCASNNLATQYERTRIAGEK